MAVKHLRHATANLGEVGLGCSTLVVIDYVLNATIRLQHKENNTCEYACNFISYQKFLSVYLASGQTWQSSRKILNQQWELTHDTAP